MEYLQIRSEKAEPVHGKSGWRRLARQLHKSWTSRVLWQNGYQNVAERLSHLWQHFLCPTLTFSSNRGTIQLKNYEIGCGPCWPKGIPRKGFQAYANVMR